MDVEIKRYSQTGHEEPEGGEYVLHTDYERLQIRMGEMAAETDRLNAERELLGKVSESIFSGTKHIIPMADVSHVEKHWYRGEDMTPETLKGYLVVTKHTTWNGELDCHNNNPYLDKDEGERFLKAWCQYRHELELGTLAN